MTQGMGSSSKGLWTTTKFLQKWHRRNPSRGGVHDVKVHHIAKCHFTKGDGKNRCIPFLLRIRRSSGLIIMFESI